MLKALPRVITCVGSQSDMSEEFIQTLKNMEKRNRAAAGIHAEKAKSENKNTGVSAALGRTFLKRADTLKRALKELEL